MPARSVLPSLMRQLIRRLLLVLALWVMALTAVIWAVLAHEVRAIVDHRLHEAAEVLGSLVRPMEAAYPSRGKVWPDDDPHEVFVWQVIRATSQVRLRSEQSPEAPLVPRLVEGARDSTDGQWRVATMALPGGSDEFIAVAQRLERRETTVWRAVAWSLGLSTLLAAVAALLIGWLVRHELRPLNALSQRVQAYDPLQPETEPRRSEWAELAPMAESVIELGGRLSRRLISERAFNAHAAHALRTPLAAMEAQLAVAQSLATPELRPWLVHIRASTQRLGRVMHVLLTLFRSGVEMNLQRVAVSDLVQMWSDPSVRVECLGDPDVVCDPDLFSATLANLLDNARAHGATQVQVTATQQGDGWAVLRVQDNGSGCTPEQRDELRRAMASHDYQPGEGLKGMGLMLADVVMHAHQGVATLPPTDVGFCVELRWPTNPGAQHPRP